MAFLLAAAPAPALDVSGRWEFRAGDTTIFRLEIVTTSAGTAATWERPSHFDTDGESFSHVSGPIVRRQARSVRAVNGDTELSFDDPAPDATPDIFLLHRVDADHIDATYTGTGFEPFDMIRATAASQQLGGWDSQRSYRRTRATNAEMTAIFDADQADRQVAKIDWSVVGPADERRRARTNALLASGALHSGDDFYDAAFVFQHGSVPGDYLKAHLLAMIAVARGKPGAVWIASATLDRYLQTIGKPQVLGTQFSLPKGAPATQEPYDRALVSDAMRMALDVPPLVEQERRRLQLSDEPAAKKAPN